MNDEAVYRTAPATPGLLIMDYCNKLWAHNKVLSIEESHNNVSTLLTFQPPALGNVGVIAIQRCH